MWFGPCFFKFTYSHAFRDFPYHFDLLHSIHGMGVPRFLYLTPCSWTFSFPLPQMLAC